MKSDYCIVMFSAIFISSFRPFRIILNKIITRFCDVRFLFNHVYKVLNNVQNRKVQHSVGCSDSVRRPNSLNCTQTLAGLRGKQGRYL